MRVSFLSLLLSLTACGPTGAVDTASSGDTSYPPAGRCGTDAEVGLEVGQCAPDFTLPDSTDQPFTLSSLRGKVALVDISAVW